MNDFWILGRGPTRRRQTVFVSLRGQLPATGRVGYCYDTYGSCCISLSLSLSLSLHLSLSRHWILTGLYWLVDWMAGSGADAAWHTNDDWTQRVYGCASAHIPFQAASAHQSEPASLPPRYLTLIRPISRLIGCFYFPRLIVCRNNSPNPNCGSDWSSRRACWRTIRKRLLVNPKFATCFTCTKVQVLTPRPPGFLISSLLHALLVQKYK